jgi:sterol desaturase/sphingolipid hydroxylase (fatty acid hydroxylase superfamily)
VTALPVTLPAADAVRFGLFLGLLALLLVAEWRRPFRAPGGLARRATNVALMTLGAVGVRLVVPLVPVAWAAASSAVFPGLFGFAALPAWLEGMLTVILLDGALYLQHRAMHAIPALWRLHRVHHLDTRVDVTTGVRFHPLEFLISMAWKLAVISLLGAHPLWVLAYEMLLSSFALWTHANIGLPPAADRRLRWLVATPSMHRTHHSVVPAETDGNYANFLTVWDRSLGTYRDRAASDEHRMPLGLSYGREAAEQRLLALLVNPARTHHDDTPARS